MSTIALSGQDAVVLNGRVFSDLADGNCVELRFPTDIMQVKTGKNGNSIYALNESGKQCEVDLRVVRGSADDKFLLNLLSNQQANPPGFPLMQGEFVKLIGDGKGNISNDTYVISGGVFVKIPEAKSNVEGDTEQSVVIYRMKFSNAPRVIT